MKRLLLFVIAVFLSYQANCQISRLEYFIDTDPGYGKGKAVSITAGPSIDQTFNIPLDLSNGFHTLGIRAKSSDGVWSHTHFRTFMVKKDVPTKVVRVEYYIDKDPGYGKGKAIPLTEDEDGYLSYNIPLTDIPEGFRLLGVRTLDDIGSWSQTQQTVFLNKKGRLLPHIVRLEYYFTGEGAPDKRYSYTLPKPSSSIDLETVADLSDLKPQKEYTIHVTAIDENGLKGNVVAATFSIKSPILIEKTEVTNLSCFGADDGSVTITATHNDGDLEYSLDGKTYGTKHVFEGLAAGSYTAYVRAKGDADHVMKKTFAITAPAKLALAIQDIARPACPDDVSGGFKAVASGGSGAYIYRLQGQGDFQSGNLFQDLPEGTYTVTVKDKNGCELSTEVELKARGEATPVPTVSLEGIDGVSAEVSLVSSSATGNQWLKDGVEIPGATGQSLDVTEAGTYQVVVTGSGGCPSSSEILAITSTPRILELDLKLFPNPAESYTRVDLGRGLHLDRVVIYRLDGVVVRDIREGLGVIGDLVIDLEGIPGGVYIVQIEGDRLFERLKLIKK